MNSAIKRNIKKYGLTSVEIANRLSITKQTLSQTINGNPTLSSLCDIAKVMGISVSELLNDDESTAAHPDGCVCPVCGAHLRLVADETDASNKTESK